MPAREALLRLMTDGALEVLPNRTMTRPYQLPITLRTIMPVFHVHIPKYRYSREQKIAIGNALNQSLVEALNIPKEDRFIIISEHGDDELFIDPTFMDMNRTENAMIITVLFGAHRPESDKKTLLSTITSLLEKTVGVSPDDVFVALVPVPMGNFSFGRGIAQLAGIGPKW